MGMHAGAASPEQAPASNLSGLSPARGYSPLNITINGKMSSKDIHDMQDPRHQFYDGKYEKQRRKRPACNLTCPRSRFR